MRCRSSCLVLLAGCNRIFGVSLVVERDAAFYDTHVDAPFTCPPIGTAPTFDHGHLVQVLAQTCGLYSQSEDGTRALALCDEGRISEGAADGSLLAPAPGLEGASNISYRSPRLGPDGMTATVVRLTADPSGMNPTTSEALLVTRDADTWRTLETIARPAMIALSVSQPTRGPGAHVLVALANNELHEFVDTGTGWDDRYTFMLPSYSRLSSIALSPDGLRAWFDAGDVYYADRPTMNDPFTDLGPVPGTSGFGKAFIASDCGWIYFSALQRIWRAPRS